MKMLKVILTLTLILAIISSIPSINNCFAEEKETLPQTQTEDDERWGALDEVVIEKFAKEKGKEPKPFIELEGDLILAVFSLFSGIAGFIIGYYSRVIFVETNKK